MAKLYPPYLEGSLPAFTGTANFVVPFSMNRAVGLSEVKGIDIKIKKVNSNEVVYTSSTTNFTDDSAFFTIDSNIFQVGHFYRAQIAYIGLDDEIGLFSTVGVIKYTAEPVVSILELDKSNLNFHSYNYTGSYEQKNDPSEKLYSSRFILYNENNEIEQDSDEIIHSVLNDAVPSQALEKYQIGKDLEDNKIYKLQLTITTINGLKIKSPLYKITQQAYSDSNFEEVKKININAENNFDEGSVEIKINSAEEKIAGSFLISRSEDKKPYKWEKIKFILQEKEKPINKIYQDYTVEQGKTYIYSIQQYNIYEIYSTRIFSNPVYADFEDTFLLDSSQQLKIRYNAKISSMKDNILETKVNTIGSKYPFITRNGRVNHKEFSISGLVSYLMDKENNFMDWKTLGIEVPHTNLTSDNIYAERQFKLKVLEWLNNGELKILKTPTEGNYIVRIMSVSMAPNDTVGRMLHTFSCSATEMAPFNYESLSKYSFINIGKSKMPKTTFWKTIELDGKSGEVLSHPVDSIKITNMIPGSIVYINGESFTIGATGAYIVNTGNPIYSLRIPEETRGSGSIDVEYQDILKTPFDNIQKYSIKGIPVKQFISYGEEVISSLQDIKTKIISIQHIRFKKREVYEIPVDSTPTVSSLLDLYKYENTDNYYDPYSDEKYESKKDIFNIKIDGETVSIEDINEYELNNVTAEKIYAGIGVIIEISYYAENIKYSCESTLPEVLNYNKYYQEMLKEITSVDISPTHTLTELNNLYQIMIKAIGEEVGI